MKYGKQLLRISLVLALIGFGYLLGTTRIGARLAAHITVAGKPVDGAVYLLDDAPGVLIVMENRWAIFLGYGEDPPHIAVTPNQGFVAAFGALYRLRTPPIQFLSQGIEPLPDWDPKAKWEDDGASFTLPGDGGGRVHLQFKLADETT